LRDVDSVGWSKIALSHWQSQSQLTQGWRYRAACDEWSVVTTTSSRTVSEILPLYSIMYTKCDLANQFLKKKKQLKLQATCAFRFTWKHVIDNTCLEVRELEKFQKWCSRSFKVTGNGAIWWANYDFLSVFDCNYVYILHPFRDIIT